MIPRQHIDLILAAAVKAPSADNAQPWKFIVSDDEITILNIPEPDKDVNRLVENAAFVSHGCLLENMRLVALSIGYSVKTELCEQGEAIAIVRLIRQQFPVDDLHGYISTRTSNRKPYSSEPISEQDVDYLLNDEFPFGVRVVLKSGSDKDALAIAASIHEKIVLEERLLHKFLFDHVTWSKKQDKQKHGFYIETFEFTRLEKFAFRLFSYWKILQLFNRFGVSNFVSNQNAELYKRSAAIGVVIANETNRTDYINAGIAIERIWLRATKLGLGFQPLTGIPLLMNTIRQHREGLALRHLELLKKAYRKIQVISESPAEHILALFRLGRAPMPSCRTSRKKPDLISSAYDLPIIDKRV